MKFTFSIFFFISSAACWAADEAYFSDFESLRLAQIDTQNSQEFPTYTRLLEVRPLVLGNPFYSHGFYSSSHTPEVPDGEFLEIAHLDGQYRHPAGQGIAFGYPLDKSWMLYAGYSDTDSNIGVISEGASLQANAELYQSESYYLGGSYQMTLGLPGLLTLNMGYSSLDTSNVTLARGFCELGDEACARDSLNTNQLSSSPNFKQNTTVSAWTYGVIWLIPVTENMAVNTSLKMNDYQENVRPDGDLSGDQKATFFNLGVEYAF